MKRIILLFSFFVLLGCNKVDENNNINQMFCYKDYNSYEEYIDFSYKDNIIENIGFSYVFDELVDKDSIEKELESYDNISYKIDDYEVNIYFLNNFKKDDFISIKEYFIKNYNIEIDSYSYFNEDDILYSLFSSYIEDYSCE